MKNPLKSILNISPRKRFRTKIRIGFIVSAALLTYWISYLFEEHKYGCAVIPFSLILLISLAEFVVADILTDRRYPKEQKLFLINLKQE
jgi:hypothetical protein